ncbi:hypothetical protein DFH07DRAFT_488949 [Mycena maculata]|uniref:Uncharacterized protein n=1 Tax=Mycena maculata TaxID=230809 RepID=A0AAD7J2J0_9AGAR|nr:hypothetical protein DFH07DRAFT_488949 [Mycena maculata]
MEGPYAQPQPVPRLRLSRQPLAMVADRPEESHPGPSRPRDPPVVEANGDDDHRPTPKAHPNSNASPPVEAAARLRALLSRTNQPKSPVARPVSPSEVESDFDPPRFSPTTPSVVKESLKDIFSRALRDPGDTPVKSRPRRNSIDTSEVEASPRVRERAKNKGKRKSLSDEEAEKPSRSSQRSEASFWSSQAATFDILRERLTNSRTPLRNEVAPTPLYDNSSAEDTTDTTGFLKDLNLSRATPPAATSTPLHSMEMSTDSKYQTNLMDRDSEMQHMMKDLDSFEGDSGPSRPVSFPPSRGKPGPRPGSSHAHTSHRMSYNGTRPISQTSTNSSHDSHHDHHDQQDHVHELEREWNKPQPKPTPRPTHSHSHSHGPAARSNSPAVTVNGHSRTRTRSGGSVHSAEDGLSSNRSSISSQSDYKDRMHELEKERNAEREYAWNRPQAARSTSTLSVHSPMERSCSPMERSRKVSQSPRPDSSQSMLSPALTRHHSGTSSRGSSDEEEEIKHEIEHERERNWGAPIPRWHQHPLPGHNHHGHSRSTSPMPASPSASTSSNLRSTERVRAESLRSRGTPKGDSPVHRHEVARPTVASSSKIPANATPALHSQTRPKSLLRSGSRPRPMSYPARPNSPLPPPLEGKSKSAIPASTSSTRIPHSQPRSPERDRGHSITLSSPSPSPGNRPASRNSVISHIPIRSPAKTQHKPPGTINGHTRTPAESHSSDPFSQSQVADVPRTSEPERPESPEFTDGGQDGDPFTETDEEVNLQEDRTPTLNTIAIPATERTEQRLPPKPVAPSDDEDLFQKALTVAPPPSPPPSPPTPTISAPPAPPEPEAPPTILGLLSTPPKRPSFTSSRLEFQTPSPPHGLPDLPGPPSSDEETETERPAPTPLRFNDAPDMTSTKTPRPPGAWTSTPAPVARAHSLPPPEHDDSDSQYESGLATPVASLSRASSFPAQTPKPPGGWVATPTPRKSILKVRFNPQPSELELSATEDFSSNGLPEKSLHLATTGLATPVEEESLRVQTPELPTIPTSPSRSPRRSPTIRLVDEYGRPDKWKPAKSPKNRNKNPIRIVDAMGREVENLEPPVKIEESPLNHNDALRTVREGVSDLVQGLEEMDISGDFVLLDEDRLRELDNVSRVAREARDGLKQAYHNDRTAQLRASMQRSKSTSEIDSRSLFSRIWFWSFIILFQALFICLLYRLQRRSVRELFLTTYYDPFYPDIHLYGIGYYLSSPRTPQSMPSLSLILREEGFKAFFASLVDTTTVLFADWRADTWRRWGADDMQSVRWPPT